MLGRGLLVGSEEGRDEVRVGLVVGRSVTAHGTKKEERTEMLAMARETMFSTVVGESLPLARTALT